MSTPSWLGDHGAQPALHLVEARWPNYPALIEVLLNDVRHLPDGLGETILNPAEAAKIRACGWTAYAGRMWYCPLLPDEIVWNTPLQHLSDAIVRNWGDGSGAWHPRRATFHEVSPIDPLSKREHQIINLLLRSRNGCLSRRELFQRISRWADARYLDHLLSRLTSEDRVTAQGSLIYPYSRSEFEARQRKAREPRRPTLLYAR